MWKTSHKELTAQLYIKHLGKICNVCYSRYLCICVFFDNELWYSNRKSIFSNRSPIYNIMSVLNDIK